MSGEDMELKIITPKKSETLEVAWVEIETLAGGFVILPGHAPMVATLKPDEDLRFCLENGKQETIKPLSGTVEVSRKDVKLLLTAVK